jgi:hypothetical protein
MGQQAKAYNTSIKSLKNHPALFLPFIIFAILEVITLIIIYLVPQMPLRLVLGPVIRTFWGERFLHYPANFLLLPKLASLSRMGLAVIFSSLLSGVAVALVFAVYNKKQIKFKEAFRAALKKYSSLFIVVLIFTLLFYFLVRLVTIVLVSYFIAGHSRLLFLKAGLWMGPILSAINFMLALLIQSAFVYAIPLLIIEKQKLIKAVIGSFVLFKKLFIPTLILVGLPMLVYIPIIVLNSKTAFLIDKVFPEFVLWVYFFGIVISSLLIDPIVTVSTTFLYLLNKEQGIGL